jgi:hypothetical protein
VKDPEFNQKEPKLVNAEINLISLENMHMLKRLLDEKDAHGIFLEQEKRRVVEEERIRLENEELECQRKEQAEIDGIRFKLQESQRLQKEREEEKQRILEIERSTKEEEEEQQRIYELQL